MQKGEQLLVTAASEMNILLLEGMGQSLCSLPTHINTQVLLILDCSETERTVWHFSFRRKLK